MNQYIPIVNYSTGKPSNIPLDIITSLEKNVSILNRKMDTIFGSTLYNSGIIPPFYKPIENDVDKIISVCSNFIPISTLISNIESTKPVWIYTIPPSVDLAIRNIMLSPTAPLFPNQSPNTYQRRLMISNDSGDPIYMKLGTLPYNTQIIVTQKDTLIPIQNVPLKTVTGRETVSIRSDFVPSNPPNINDIPLSPTISTIESPFTTRKEVMSAIIGGAGYSNRNNLSNVPGYYVAKIFTNSVGQQYVVRVSYH